MTQLTSNTTAFIEAEQYSDILITNLQPIMLPEIFWRDVSDFGHGDTLHIKTIGDVIIQEVSEDTPLVSNPIDTGEVTLTITDHVGAKWGISDVLREDGNQVAALMGEHAMAATRAFAQNHESRFLAVAANSVHTLANVNLVNGMPHRWVAGGAAATNRVMTLEDFAVMGLSFDVADVPAEGRVAIVPPVVATTIETLTNLVNVSNNPMFQGIVETGFARNHRFVKNVYGWDVWTSNRLPAKTATEALDASAYALANDTAEIGDLPCIFMNIADDNSKPIMHAWRVRPTVKGWRDDDLFTDRFQSRSRFGFAGQRSDTLGVVWVHPTNRA